jgi:hypothetical protein
VEIGALASPAAVVPYTASSPEGTLILCIFFQETHLGFWVFAH